MRTAIEGDLGWNDTVAGVDALHLPSALPRRNDQMPVLVFDGDDTLWATEHLYDNAREAAASIVTDVGLSADRWRTLQLEIDVKNVGRFGLLAERFPTSCVEAYLALAAELGIEPDFELERTIWDAASAVFRATAPTMPNAPSVLSALRKNFRIVLLTQGDPRVQIKRIADSNLQPLFDDVVIVSKKSSSVLAALVDAFGIEHHNSWMIGNSIPSDINPAVSVGMRAVWIDAHVWDHERREVLADDGRVTRAKTLDDLLTILGSDDGDSFGGP